MPTRNFRWFTIFDFSRPQNLLTGMNTFLHNLDITFRRDPTNFRPRINKFDSLKDKEQKASGNYFFIDVWVKTSSTQLLKASYAWRPSKAANQQKTNPGQQTTTKYCFQ